KDQITTLGGDDIVMGDDGNLTFTAAGILTVATTSDPASGDADTVNAGAGRNVVLGGAGNDSITTLGGDDYIIGDNGNFAFTPAGVITLATTTDPTLGGDDSIDADGGNNYILGGAGADRITTAGGNDFVMGDFGKFTFTTAGQITEGVTT